MDEIEATVIQHTEQIKTLFNKTEQQQKLIDTVNSLAVSVKELAIGQSNLTESVGKIRRDVDEIKDKPGKRWDSIVEKVIWALIAAALGLVLGKFGM